MPDIPKWAKYALINGKFYERALAPDMWLRECGPTEAGGAPDSLTPDQVKSFSGHVAFWREDERSRGN